MAVPGVSGRPGWVKRLMAWLGPARAIPAVVRARGTAPRAAVPPPPDRLDAVLDDLVAGPAAPPAVVLDEPDPAVARVLHPLLSARDAGTAVYRPAVGRLAELMDLAPDDFNGTVRLITSEPAIIAAVLATANSAEFRRGAAVADIREAVGRLGLVQVRQLALAVTARALQEPDASAAGIRRVRGERDLHRALTTAFACSWLSLQYALAQPDRTFVAAMFLDVGRPLIYRDLARLEHAAGRAPVSDAIAEQLVDAAHARLGAQTLAAWGLPDAVVAMCRHHHDELLPAELDRREWHAVRAVSGLVHLRGGQPVTAATRASLAALALDRPGLRALLVSLDELSDRASRLLGVPAEAAAWPTPAPITA